MTPDIMFPARKACSPDSENTIFGRLFGIPLQNQCEKRFIPRVTNDKMLCI